MSKEPLLNANDLVVADKLPVVFIYSETTLMLMYFKIFVHLWQYCYRS